MLIKDAIVHKRGSALSPSITSAVALPDAANDNGFSTYVRAQQGMRLTGVKSSTWYALQDPASAQFDKTFPPSYQLTQRTRVWKTAELIAWIESKRKPISASKAGGV